MRFPIIREGVMLPGNWYVAPGAVNFNQNPIPVTLGDSSGEIVGKADDIQRDDDGNITAEVALRDEEFYRLLENGHSLELHGFFNNMGVDPENFKTILSCNLIATRMTVSFPNNTPTI